MGPPEIRRRFVEAFLRGFAFISEGVAQRSAKLRHHDVQALDGRTFRLMGLWPLQQRVTTPFVTAGTALSVPRRDSAILDRSLNLLMGTDESGMF